MKLSGEHEMRLRTVARQMSKPGQASIGESMQRVPLHPCSSLLFSLPIPLYPQLLWSPTHSSHCCPALPWTLDQPSRSRGSGKTEGRVRNSGPLCTMQPLIPSGMEPARSCHHPGSESPASISKSLSASDG